MFSLNAKSKIGHRSTYAATCQVSQTGWPIFTQDGRLSHDQTTLLHRRELSLLLDQTTLQEGESLHFSNGDIQIYLRFPSLERVRTTIEKMIDLADATEVSEEDVDLRSLPAEFHRLIPSIKQWAIVDDLGREELLEAAQDADLKRLLDEVDPYLPALNAYLDSFGPAPPTKAACALGCLAECVVEVKRKLADATAD